MLTSRAVVSLLGIPSIDTFDRKGLRFKHVEDLQSALKEYAAFHDGTIVRNYGPPNSARSRTAEGR